MQRQKPITFCGGSLEDPKAFPVSARRTAGYQLDRVQAGLEPDDWKSMASIGPGVREIRVRDADGAFRVIYVAKLARAIFVLHCFQKQGQKTARQDLEMAGRRYRALLKEIE